MTVLVLLLAYLLGSIPFSYFVVKAFTGLDPRYNGNGNVGARNSIRLAGLWPGILVIVLDAAKGAVTYWVVHRWAPEPWVFYAAVFALLLGHVYPVWLGFRGGIGQAALTGFICVWNPLAAAIAVPLFVLLKLFVPIFNVAYAIAAVVYLGIAWWQGLSWQNVLFIIGMFLLLLAKKLADAPRQQRVLAEWEARRKEETAEV